MDPPHGASIRLRRRANTLHRRRRGALGTRSESRAGRARDRAGAARDRRRARRPLADARGRGRGEAGALLLRRSRARRLAVAADAPRLAQHRLEPDPRPLSRRPPLGLPDRARGLLDPGARRPEGPSTWARPTRASTRSIARASGAGGSTPAGSSTRRRRSGRAGPAAGFPITVGSGDEALYQLRSSDRRLKRGERIRWEFRTGLAPATGQLVNWWEGNPAYGPDGNLYVGNTGGGTFSLTPRGEQRWVVQRQNSVWTTPAFDAAGNSYWGSVDFFAFSLDPSGALRWQTFTPGYVTASPALGSDGTVYTGSFDRSLYALDPGTGSVRWSFPTADHIYSSPALASGPDGATEAVYIGSADGSVYAVGADGTQLWRYDTGEPVRSSPVLGRAPQRPGTDPLRRLVERQALRPRRRDRAPAVVVRHHARGSAPAGSQRPQRLAGTRPPGGLHRRRARTDLVRPLRLLPEATRRPL